MIIIVIVSNNEALQQNYLEPKKIYCFTNIFLHIHQNQSIISTFK